MTFEKSRTMSIDSYTFVVTWSPDDGEHVGRCIEFPSLSWLAPTPEEALHGIRKTVTKVIADMHSNGEPIGQPPVRYTLQSGT